MKQNLFMMAVVLFATSLVAQDDLAERASWEVPTTAQVKESIDKWLTTRGADDITRLKIDTLWEANDQEASAVQILDQVAAVISVVHQPSRELMELCADVRKDPSAPDYEFLANKETDEFVRNNMRLYYGRWLTQHDLFDEALRQMDSVDSGNVVDPASLLFYQSVAHHRLLKKKECLSSLSKLLENVDALPRRYKTVGELMLADIKPLKTDSLDEVARLMKDIRRRQALYRSGTIVRKEEDDVLAKLDKLIEELEKQQQQGGGGGGGGGGNKGGSQPSSPMNDSMPGGGTGPGNIDPKKLGRDGDWGDLPPSERQAVLQDLSKDLPAHFREVIEEYFKNLAKDEE